MNKKVLLVDDMDVVLLIEKLMLSEEPYELLTATSGEEALKKVQEQAPDLVVLDIKMPGIDGIEVCRRIKAEPKSANVKVLMVTVKADPEYQRRAEEAGCDGFFSKPIVQVDLKNKISSLLTSVH